MGALVLNAPDPDSQWRTTERAIAGYCRLCTGAVVDYPLRLVHCSKGEGARGTRVNRVTTSPVEAVGIGGPSSANPAVCGITKRTVT